MTLSDPYYYNIYIYTCIVIGFCVFLPLLYRRKSQAPSQKTIRLACGKCCAMFMENVQEYRAVLLHPIVSIHLTLEAIVLQSTSVSVHGKSRQSLIEMGAWGILFWVPELLVPFSPKMTFIHVQPCVIQSTFSLRKTVVA